MPPDALAHLKKVWVAGQRLMLSPASARDAEPQPDERPPRKHGADDRGAGFGPPKRKFDKPKFSGPKRKP